MQEIRVKVNQIELQIRDYEQEGDAIVFLHFSGANLMMWQRVIPFFQDHYRFEYILLIFSRGLTHLPPFQVLSHLLQMSEIE